MNNQNHHSVIKNTFKITISLFLLMFAFALSFTMIGPLLPAIRSEYGISLSQSGLITLFQGIGGALSVLLGMFVSGMFPKSTIIKIAFLIYGVSVLFITFIPYYIVLLILFFILGGSTRLVSAYINAYMADIHVKKRSFYMNLLHACFGAGALLGPIFSAMFLAAQLPWRTAFIGLCVICFLLLIVFALIDKHSQAIGEKEKSNNLYQVLLLFKQKSVLTMCFICFCYVGFAMAISTWIPSYIQESFQIKGFLASYPVAAFWIGVTAGRVVYSYWSQKYNLKRLMFVSNLLAGIIVLVTILYNTYLGFIAGFILTGFFIGATSPLAYSILNAFYPLRKGAVSSALTFFETLGIMLIPWIVGIIAENASFWTGLLILFIFPVAISILSLFISTQTDHAEIK